MSIEGVLAGRNKSIKIVHFPSKRFGKKAGARCQKKPEGQTEDAAWVSVRVQAGQEELGQERIIHRPRGKKAGR